MTSQLALTYAPRASGHDDWMTHLESIRTAVNYLGLKEVSFELDISGSLLSDALHERDRKGWRASWTHVLHRMLAARRGDQIAEKLLRVVGEAGLASAGLAIEGDEELTEDELKVALVAVAQHRRKAKR